MRVEEELRNGSLKASRMFASGRLATRRKRGTVSRVMAATKMSSYESFIYKSSSFKVSLPQCAQHSIAWESLCNHEDKR